MTNLRAKAKGRLSGCLVYQRRMILQIHYACQIDVVTRVRARDRLPVRVMAEVFTKEVLLQVAAAEERL